ncbi:MAG: hypothetical protein U0L04_10810, partial [Bacteroidaceae bacterium]|nr:hypothetical protein [Bacteroidaceae bacterium]
LPHIPVNKGELDFSCHDFYINASSNIAKDFPPLKEIECKMLQERKFCVSLQSLNQHGALSSVG